MQLLFVFNRFGKFPNPITKSIETDELAMMHMSQTDTQAKTMVNTYVNSFSDASICISQPIAPRSKDFEEWKSRAIENKDFEFHTTTWTDTESVIINGRKDYITGTMEDDAKAIINFSGMSQKNAERAVDQYINGRPIEISVNQPIDMDHTEFKSWLKKSSECTDYILTGQKTTMIPILGDSFEKVFTININDINEAPTIINLSNNSIGENVTVGTLIGTLSNDDPDTTDTTTYAFVTGDGTNDADNSLLTIDPNTGEITTKDTINFETKDTYNVYIETTDSGGNKLQQAFVINVNDLDPELASPITDASAIVNVAINKNISSHFETTDPVTNPFTFTATLTDGSPLPTGLIIDGTTGIISGKSSTGASDIRITATNTIGSISDDFTLTINPVVKKKRSSGGGGSSRYHGTPSTKTGAVLGTSDSNEVTTDANIFSDVESTHGEVFTASGNLFEKGIISGAMKNGKRMFFAKENLRRVELGKIILKMKNIDYTNYSDDISNTFSKEENYTGTLETWEKQVLNALSENDIAKGYKDIAGVFGARNETTEGEFARMLLNARGDQDYDSSENWTLTYRNLGLSTGVMKAEESYEPNKPVLRERMAIYTDRSLEHKVEELLAKL